MMRPPAPRLEHRAGREGAVGARGERQHRGDLRRLGEAVRRDAPQPVRAPGICQAGFHRRAQRRGRDRDPGTTASAKPIRIGCTVRAVASSQEGQVPDASAKMRDGVGRMHSGNPKTRRQASRNSRKPMKAAAMRSGDVRSCKGLPLPSRSCVRRGGGTVFGAVGDVKNRDGIRAAGGFLAMVAPSGCRAS
jgi:hypothetical protein